LKSKQDANKIGENNFKKIAKRQPSAIGNSVPIKGIIRLRSGPDANQNSAQWEEKPCIPSHIKGIIIP
jgi:hypothetical protein